MATLTKEYDKSFYENYSIINPNLDEIEKILNDYITSYNRKFDIYFINCDLNLVFDNNFKIHIEIDYCQNKDYITKIKSCLLYWIITNYKDVVLLKLMRRLSKPLAINVI